eukprot:Nitzschia sp. Nitz4//scaffold37_size175936//169241//171469//NITZ4_002071-RA/size175936-snap-gene-0.250-mRNA-1//1//CDS//3329549863//2214//frame0
MGKKKGKKDDDKKAALAARKEAKQEKSAKKRLAKQGGGLPDEGDNDLDQVLQAYKSQDIKVAAVDTTDKAILEPLDSQFPLPRSNATLCDVESEKKDNFYLFGGEYYDGVANIVLDELLRYDATKKEWKQILTSPRPSPRCAHSCVSYKQYLYVFGGELATDDQYHHYRDLWKFDVNTMKWTEVVAKNPPSARSGHACIVWKQYMILFGGFFEALRETKWYNDIHVFNLQTETWMDVPQSRLAIKPEPRSACNVATFGADKVIIHGGFSKMKSANSSAESKVHTDAWVLHLSPILQQQAPTWERWMSSTKGTSKNTPNGRAGTASISYKSRMLVFGGVVDSEQLHHKVESVFFNDLMAMDMERRKWFPLRVKAKAAGGGGRRRRKPKDDDNDGNEEEGVSEAEESESEAELEEEENDGGDELIGWDLDTLRANMFAFVDGDGNIVYEKIEDDELEKSKPKEGHDEEEEKEEEEEEEEKEEEKEEEPEQQKKVKVSVQDKNTSKKITSSSVMVVNPETNAPEAVARTEPLPRINASVVVRGNTLYLYGGILENRTPANGESLADFYTRTSKYWNGQAAEIVQVTGEELSNKELKREGFKLAKNRFEELKPILDRLAELIISTEPKSKSDKKSKDKSKGSKRSK